MNLVHKWSVKTVESWSAALSVERLSVVGAKVVTSVTITDGTVFAKTVYFVAVRPVKDPSVRSVISCILKTQEHVTCTAKYVTVWYSVCSVAIRPSSGARAVASVTVASIFPARGPKKKRAALCSCQATVVSVLLSVANEVRRSVFCATWPAVLIMSTISTTSGCVNAVLRPSSENTSKPFIRLTSSCATLSRSTSVCQ